MQKLKAQSVSPFVLSSKYVSVQFISILPLLLCALFFTLSILSSITPISWMDTTSPLTYARLANWIFAIGGWISHSWVFTAPAGMPPATARAINFVSSALKFLFCILLAFLFYCLGAVLLQRKKRGSAGLEQLVWGIALFIGGALMRKYYLPLVVFSLAALIKFTVIPVIILFILVIVCKQRQIVSLPRLALRDKLRSWYVLFQSFLFACALSAGVALAFYAPFWVGHSAGEILFSFTSAPAARSASNSLLSVILIGKDFLHIPPTILSGQFLNELSQRSLWDRITLVAVVGSSVLSARQLWRKPTILTFAQTSLIVLSVLLMVTPWFYPWYILWLVGLAIVCLPPVTNRWGRALVGFALVFSLSAFLTYFFSGEIALMSAWEQFFRARIPILLVGSALLFINTLVPPVLTLFGIAFAPRSNLKG